MQYGGSDQGPGSARPVLIRMSLTPSFGFLVFRKGILLKPASWGCEVVRTKWLLPEVSLELRTLSRQVTATFIPAEALTLFSLAFWPFFPFPCISHHSASCRISIVRFYVPMLLPK